MTGSIADFLEEATEAIDAIVTTVEELETQLDSPDEPQEVINKLFRLLHSLKGLAGMVGITPVSELSHELETLLDALRMGRLELNKSFVDILQEGVDHLQGCIEQVSAGNLDMDIAEIQGQVKDYVQNHLTEQKSYSWADIGIDTEIVSVLTDYEIHRLHVNIDRAKTLFIVNFSFLIDDFDVRLNQVNEILQKTGEVISTLPSSEASDPDRINFQLICATRLSISEIKKSLEQYEYELTLLSSKKGVKKEREFEYRVTKESETSEVPGDYEEEVTRLKQMTSPALRQTLRVDLNRVNNAMNIVGELQVLESGIQGNFTELAHIPGYKNIITNIQKKLWDFQKRLEELRDGILEIRMIPLRGTLKNIERYIRKLQRESGKEITLSTAGGDTEMDKTMIDAIQDPLIHIVRNAVFHGIEPPEERTRKGKPAGGNIEIQIIPQNRNIVIRVKDDGRGLNENRIKERAMEMGVLKKEQSISRDQLFSYILLPGFSTASEIDQISGRGVGMDVVHKTVQDLKGALEIQSEHNKGTTISLLLPITLAIIPVLLVRSNSESFALPLTGIMSTMRIKSRHVQVLDGQRFFSHDDALLPLFFLNTLTGGSREIPEDGYNYVIIMQTAERRIGVVADSLVGEQDIVMKSIGKRLKTVPGIAGVAEIGDEQLVLVLDAGTLAACES